MDLKEALKCSDKMTKEEKIAYLKGASEEEKKVFFKKMDDDLENFIIKKAKKAAKKREKEPKEEKSIDQILEELSTHPAFLTELDYSKPFHPLVDGLIELKYNAEDAKDNAVSYKEEGNRLYKLKDYRLAIDNYTEGIKARCVERQLNAVLYTNRALCHYQLGNLRSSINDCIVARKFVPEHAKAIYRGCVCSLEVKKYEECVKWCNVGLALEPDNVEIEEIKTKAEKFLKAEERDRRKELAKERKEKEEQRKLLDVIKNRGVKIGWVPELDKNSRVNPLDLTSLESHHPSGAQVHLDEEGFLHWPVLFMYPEHSVTDFIEAFKETDRFVDHLAAMFGEDVEPAPWDEDKKYRFSNIEVYFEDKEEEKLYKVCVESTLLEALSHDRYCVHAGTPAFILLVSGSKYREVFLERNKK